MISSPEAMGPGRLRLLEGFLKADHDLRPEIWVMAIEGAHRLGLCSNSATASSQRVRIIDSELGG